MTQEAEVDSVFKLPKSFPSFPRPDHSYQFSIETWPLHKLGESHFLSRTKITSLLGSQGLLECCFGLGGEIGHKLLLTGRSEVKGSRTISKGFPLNRMRGYWLSGNVKSHII